MSNKPKNSILLLITNTYTMTKPPKIREYKEADSAGIQLLMNQLGYDHQKEDIRQNIQNIQEHGGKVYVALVDGCAAGCTCALLDARLAEGLYGEIASLIVAKRYRGRGLGKQLVEKAETWLKTRTDKIRVRANTVRIDAHQFYESAGYTSIKDQKIFVKHL